MPDESVDDVDEPLASVLAVLEDPSDGRRHLPRLVGLLDDEDEAVRIGAAWATALVAATAPDVADYLTRRLADRLGDDPSLETEVAFAYLSARHPEAVEAELEAIDEEMAERAETSRTGSALASATYPVGSLGNRSVGRTKTAGDGTTSDPRQVYTDSGSSGPRNRGGHAGDEPADGDAASDDAKPPSAGVDGSADSGAGGDGPTGGSAGPADGERGRDRARGDVPLTIGYPVQAEAEGWASVDVLTDVAYASRFDELTVYGRRRGRYADVYRSLGMVDGKEYPVGLALFHRPESRSDAFTADLCEELDRWAAVGDHANVVGVHDWGAEPRPWAALEYTDATLAGREPVWQADALWNARRLADALEHLHRNGVVHAGLDPRNVVYETDVFDEDARQPPLLSNVGLMDTVRMHFDPTERLDPRYAAPEYYDRSFGRLDHLTDVYHFGAVLYRLFTGAPPYDGSYEAVREQVLHDDPPGPSAAADVPDGLDEVVTKAMATDKLGRYETVADMARELRGLRSAEAEGASGRDGAGGHRATSAREGGEASARDSEASESEPTDDGATEPGERRGDTRS